MNKLQLSIKHTLAAALTLLLVMLSACASNEEREAQQMLQQARSALRHRLYSEARDSILSLRKKHPTAINARKQGILLLDSIETASQKPKATSGKGST